MLRLALLFVFLAIPSFGQIPSNVCPSISVTGPAGIPNPDEPILFVANVSGNLPKNIKYRWTVTGGEILDGHDSIRIRITYDKNSGETIVATFEVLGLPDECPSRASESMIICGPGFPILIDEFPTVLNKIQEEQFLIAAGEQKNNPYDQLYIIEYFPRGTSEFDIRERHKRLREFLVKRGGLSESSFTLVSSTYDEGLTKIYRVPPGALNPEP